MNIYSPLSQLPARVIVGEERDASTSCWGHTTSIVITALSVLWVRVTGAVRPNSNQLLAWPFSPLLEDPRIGTLAKAMVTVDTTARATKLLCLIFITSPPGYKGWPGSLVFQGRP